MGVMFPSTNEKWDEAGWFVEPVDPAFQERFGFGPPRSWVDAESETKNYELPFWLATCVLLLFTTIWNTFRREGSMDRLKHDCKYFASAAAGVAILVTVLTIRTSIDNHALANLVVWCAIIAVITAVAVYLPKPSTISTFMLLFPATLALCYGSLAIMVIERGVAPPPLYKGLFGAVVGSILMNSVLCLPLLAAKYLREHRRKYPSSACQHCGYDLTGNVSGRCPECGLKTGPAIAPGSKRD